VEETSTQRTDPKGITADAGTVDRASGRREPLS
jgi:hypothetical protein